MIRSKRLYLFFVGVFCFCIAGCSSQSSVRLNAAEKDLWGPLQNGFPLPHPTFSLNDPQLAVPVDYTRYGEFKNAGTDHYQYVVKDPKGLKNNIGAGLYPNESGVLKETKFQDMKRSGSLKGSHWEALNLEDKQQAFYIWSQAADDKGVKTFFTAKVLEDSGHLLPAIKAYYAVLVHFPHSVGWAANQSFVWYLAPAAIGRIQQLCRDYPALNCALEGAEFSIVNGADTDLKNDIITFNPGKLVVSSKRGRRRTNDLTRQRIVQTRGQGAVQFVQYKNGHWQMLVDHKPFVIRGITYSPTEIGLGPDKDINFFDRWMFTDTNQNGLIDAPYEAWVDQNNNDIQDADEPAVGDFQLLKDMGVNALRWFAPNRPLTTYDPTLVNKPLLRDLFKTYGVRLIVGDFFGAYTIGSGASWEKGTDYADPQQRLLMKEAVKAKVLDLKDEPFVLMWLLGNENNLPSSYMGVNASRTNAASHPEAYARFLNEVAEMIHELDPNHPVAVGNVELGLFEYYRQYAPSIDAVGVNSYRGENGFGVLFDDIKKTFDRPVFVAEYGSDAYHEGQGVNEEEQRRYHEGNLRDLVFHQSGERLTGNVVGGVIFEYLDEWWKAPGDPEGEQTIKAQGYHAFADGRNHEEWFGLAGQGSGQNSPFERQLRKAYYFYKDIWGEK